MDFRKDDERMKPLAMFSQSSLTDIVLLLLIFFLLTSSFVTNFGIRVDIPRAESGAQTESEFIEVAVTPEGEFYVEGEPSSRGELSASVREARSQKPEATLVLRADKDALVDNAVYVMNIAQALDLRIIMATERSSR